MRTRVLAWLGVALSVCWPAVAGAATDKSLIGDWEVVSVLQAGGLSNAQYSMKIDDPRLMGQRLRFTATSVEYMGTTTPCEAKPVRGAAAVSVRALFDKEGVKPPKAVTTRFYGRVKQVDARALAASRVRLYSLQCKGDSGGNAPAQTRVLNDMGNWFAATSNAIILPFAPDTPLRLERAPKAVAADQAAFCAKAEIPSDRAICADRQLWLMHTHAEAALKVAKSRSPSPLNANVDATAADYLRRRQECKGDTQCLYDTMSEHVSLTVQAW